MTIEIRINGQSNTVDASATVADVVRRHGVDERATGVAVAVNDAVVPKREWAARRIAAGDVVEIIRAVQGG
jgi:sulfur carrier protein